MYFGFFCENHPSKIRYQTLQVKQKDQPPQLVFKNISLRVVFSIEFNPINASQSETG
jgi:hypothetical protein